MEVRGARFGLATPHLFRRCLGLTVIGQLRHINRYLMAPPTHARRQARRQALIELGFEFIT